MEQSTKKFININIFIVLNVTSFDISMMFVVPKYRIINLTTYKSIYVNNSIRKLTNFNKYIFYIN